MGTFILTDEQKDLQDLAKEFSDKEIRPISAEWDVIGDTPMELYQKAAERSEEHTSELQSQR